MSPRIIGADEAHGMLEGTTEGPWQFHAPEGESSAWVTQARDRDGVPLAILDGVIEANGRLMAASWELAHTVIALHEENARLRAELARVTAERDARHIITRGEAAALVGPVCIGRMVRRAQTVADVVEFRDGVCVLHWLGDVRSTAIYPSVADAVKIHGHDGTEFHWLNGLTDAARRGADECDQDAMENAPCASIGGREAAPRVPSYIPEADRVEWLRGYTLECVAIDGPEWRTTPYRWAPALMIPGEPDDAAATDPVQKGGA